MSLTSSKRSSLTTQSKEDPAIPPHGPYYPVILFIPFTELQGLGGGESVEMAGNMADEVFGLGPVQQRSSHAVWGVARHWAGESQD